MEARPVGDVPAVEFVGVTGRPVTVGASAAPLPDEVEPGPALSGAEAGPGARGVRRSGEPPLPDGPRVLRDGRAEASVELQVDQLRPVPDGRQARALPWSRRSVSGFPWSSRISSAASPRSRARRVPFDSAARSRSAGASPRRTSRGADGSAAGRARVNSRQEPSSRRPSCTRTRPPVSLGRTLVVVQAGEYEAVRSGGADQVRALRVLQQPGAERLVVRHQPHPVADPAAHPGSRHPAGQLVGPAPGIPEQPRHLGADAPGAPVPRVGQRVPRSPATILVHPGTMPRPHPRPRADHRLFGQLFCPRVPGPCRRGPVSKGAEPSEGAPYARP